jgi:hypothetical protein
MMPLAQALQNELSQWRELYFDCPFMEKSRTKTCTDSFQRLESYLSKGDSLSILKVGKEIIATIAVLEYARELNRNEWSKSHDGLGDAYGDMRRHDNRVLKCFLNRGGEFELSSTDTSESDDESKDDDEDSNHWFAIACMVFRSWMNDERAAVGEYRHIGSLIEKTVEAGDCEQIKSEIEALLGEFNELKCSEVECSQQMVAKMLVAYHSPKDKADENETGRRELETKI